MPPAWGVEALANAGPATDSCGMKQGRFTQPHTSGLGQWEGT